VNNEATSEMRGKRKNRLGGIDKSNRVGGIDQLNEECKEFKFHFLNKTRWLLLLLSSSFYAYFLMDTCGDKSGYRIALIPFMLMLLTPVLIFVIEYILECFGYHVSPDPLPLISTKNRGVTEHGLELEATSATINPLSLNARVDQQQQQQEARDDEEDEEEEEEEGGGGGLDDIPEHEHEQEQGEGECGDSVQASAISSTSNTSSSTYTPTSSSSFSSASTFQRDVTFIRPRLRNDSIGGANAATLHALDAARMSHHSGGSGSNKTKRVEVLME